MATGDLVSARPCVLCGGQDRRVVATVGRGYVPLSTVICVGCGLVSHHPLPDPADVAAFYASKYRVEYKGAWEPKPKHVLRGVRGAVARAKRLGAHLRPGARVLDVGASSGEFTYAMSRLGFKASGVEPNQGYAEFAQRTYGVDLLNAPLQEADFGDGAFDLIALNHVFEHLTDPLEALATFGRWLGPDGLLFLEVPNLLGVRKQISNIFHYAHIWNFTPQTLLGVVRKGGFAPLEGEDLNSTSIVFRKAGELQAEPAQPDPELADRLFRQMRRDQGFAAYVLSGAPFTRRWNRLRRNLDEWRTVRRFATIRAMADAVIEAAEPTLAGGPAVLPAG
jgi:2-polyprenyl-3-methyl-5-hydroxy-6-metoxy-1,4-benzoquinol methylase